MTLAGARALLPELAIELLEPDAERHDLSELAQQLGRFAPAVAPLPPDALAAELVPPAGGRPLSTPEPVLVEQVRDRLDLLGHAASIVVADDLFAACVLAAWTEGDRVVPPSGLAQALAPLPLRALAPSLRMGLLLRDLGLRCVGDLARLPPADVAGRFGAEGVRMHRLALGGMGCLPMATQPSEGALVMGWELPCPVASVEPLLFVLNRLCGDLCAQLEATAQGLVGLTLALELEDAGTLRVALRTGRPVRSPEHLTRLLRRRLEGLQLAAPVLSVAIETSPVPFAGAQSPLLARGQALEPLADVAARLADSIGPAAIFTPSPRDRWRPEAAWAPLSIFDPQGSFLEPSLGLAPQAGAAPAPTKCGSKALDPAWVHEAWRFSLPLPRPALLLHEPRPVQLEPRLGAPERVQLEGRWLPVRHSWGPELLCVEWWAAGIDRRYWVLELADGRGLWVYCELGHAFLHGFFDQGSPAPAAAGGGGW